MGKMTYDQIQMHLGAVSDNFMSEAETIIASSSANDDTKALIRNLCTAIENSLNEITQLISNEMQL